MRGYAFEVSYGIFFGQKMSKGVDGIKSRIERSAKREISHVSADKLCLESTSIEPRLAIVESGFIQVESSDGVTSTSHLNHQSSASTARFEESFYFERDILGEHLFKKTSFPRCVFAEARIVVMGVVIPSFGGWIGDEVVNLLSSAFGTSSFRFG